MVSNAFIWLISFLHLAVWYINLNYSCITELPMSNVKYKNYQSSYLSLSNASVLVFKRMKSN